MFSYSVRSWGYTSSEAARRVLRYWVEAGETFGAIGDLETPRARWNWIRATLDELRADASCRTERRALAATWATAARRVRAAALVGAACCAGACSSSAGTAKPITTACGVARAACAVVEAACGVADAASPSSGGEEP